MAAPLGNRFWEARASHGRDKIFSSPEVLWAACVEYFEWVEANPLLEEKGFAFQGVVTKETFSKMRAMTITGLCNFLGIGESTWSDYRDREDFSLVVKQVEGVICQQKFEGAAADLLNANIIARDLGLAEKKHNTNADPDGSPAGTGAMDRLAQLLNAKSG